MINVIVDNKCLNNKKNFDFVIESNLKLFLIDNSTP